MNSRSKQERSNVLPLAARPPECSEPDIARATIEEQFGGDGNLIFCRNEFWRWNEKFWEPCSDDIVGNLVMQTMEGSKLKVTNGKLTSIVGVLKKLTVKPTELLDCQCDAICCESGELFYNQETGEHNFRDHVREHYHQSCIPVAYDAKAEAPRYRQFLDEIFDGDGDKQDKISFVNQFCGYALSSDYRFHKFLLMLGWGHNGKSVLMELLRLVLGPHNVCSVDPCQLENRFQLAHMSGKLANIVDELKHERSMSDDKIKALTSGARVTAEHKYGKPFDFRATAKFILSSNDLPPTSDVTMGFRRRAFILAFNNFFVDPGEGDTAHVAKFKSDKEPKTADPQLLEKLAIEAPGILNIWLDGLASLLISNGDFCQPKSSIEAKAEWFAENDQVEQFVNDACNLGSGFDCASLHLYKCYESWLHDCGIPLSEKITQIKLTRTLKRPQFRVKQYRSNRQRRLKGIAPA